MSKLKTKSAFQWPKVFSAIPDCRVDIPEGAPVEEVRPNEFFVEPSFFQDKIDRHDATYYGCHVTPDNVEVI